MRNNRLNPIIDDALYARMSAQRTRYGVTWPVWLHLAVEACEEMEERVGCDGMVERGGQVRVERLQKRRARRVAGG